jgi:hypothetical protein
MAAREKTMAADLVQAVIVSVQNATKGYLIGKVLNVQPSNVLIAAIQ